MLEPFLETETFLLLFAVLRKQKSIIVDFLNRMRSYRQVDRILMLSVVFLLACDLLILLDGGIVVIFFMQVVFFARSHYFTFELDLGRLFTLAVL